MKTSRTTETVVEEDFIITPPNVEHLLTEDDTPVDNIYSEKQQRLLIDTLQTASPFGERRFVASTNVGLYYGLHIPAIVPDMLLSMDLDYPPDIWEKRHRVYMIWELGKSPDVVVEIVSNTVGNEKGKKFDVYARAGVPYYIIIDPLQFLQKQLLNVYELRGRNYQLKETNFLDNIGITPVAWEGEYENMREEWVRWQDNEGILLPTGVEAFVEKTQQIEEGKIKLVNEKQRAESEKQRAESEKQRADKLAEKLRAMGINPDEI
jgi:Uma2 family endonuclease